MGAKDIKAKEYMSDNGRFADLCNLVLYNGEAVISASDLEEKDSTEALAVLGVNEKEINYQQKLRDLLKSAIIKTTETTIFVLIGVENQSDIHYAMPVKSMIYDALNYGSQVKEAVKKHTENKDYKSNAEFLSGFAKSDQLTPVIPIALYLGADEWDAPVSLHEMFGQIDERLRAFIPDYRVVLVSPNDLMESDLDKLGTDLREFLGAIKYSRNDEEFDNFIFKNTKFKDLNNETVEAINLFTGSNIEINRKGGLTDVCKAIEDGKKKAALKQSMVNIRNLFENGCTLDMVLASFKDVSEEIIRNIYAEVNEPKTLS